MHRLRAHRLRSHNPPFRPSQAHQLLLLGSVGSLMFSAYLAYVLKVVLKDFCFVCVAMYACNVAVFMGAARTVVRSMKKSSAAGRSEGKEDGKKRD